MRDTRHRRELGRPASRLAIVLPIVAAAITSFLGLSTPAEAGNCGARNQRPCTIFERIPSCDKGLYEDFGKGLCLKKSVPGRDCGRRNQRPCTLLERIPSCNEGLVEDFAKGRCVRKAVPGEDCGNANQRPCTVLERIPSCNANLKEDFAQGICVAVDCGKALGRPCTLVERIPSCDVGLVENFLEGRCVPSADAERHRIAGEKLQEIGEFVASKVGFATEVANDPRVRASLNSGNEAAVARTVNTSGAGETEMPDGYLLRTISIGATAGGKFLFVGTSGGAGAAIDLKGQRPVYVYATGNYSWGPGLAAGGALDVGFWVCQNNKIGGDSWGIEFGLDDLARASIGTASLGKGLSIGVGLWFDYDNVFQGFTITPGFGVGADFGGVVFATTAVDGDDSVGCDGRPKAGSGQLAERGGRSGRSTATATTTARGEAAGLAPCPEKAQGLRGSGRTVTCSCSPAQVSGGHVWGSGPYTDDSRICRAALHAGVISESGGILEFQVAKGRSSYQGSRRNGVTTGKYSAWPGSFHVRRPR